MDEVILPAGENTGLIPVIPPTDFRVGGESIIPYEVRLPSGKWSPYKPTDEWQRRNLAGKLGYDTMSCTDFSHLNSVESQIRFLLSIGQFTEEEQDLMRELDWFDDNGLVNFSDWFNANVAGTTYAAGNTLSGPWEGTRKFGLLPQSDGPEVNDYTGPEGWFDLSRITDKQYSKALRALEILDIKYEWKIMSPGAPAQDQFARYLKQAPIHIMTPTCASWNNKGGKLVTNCGSYRGLNHATLLMGLEEGVAYNDLDHYVPFEKRLAWDYYVPYGLMGLVTPKSKIKTPIIQKPSAPTVSLRFGMGSITPVQQLQSCLQYLKDPATGQPYMRVGLFGVYGPSTRTALGRFQTVSLIKDPDGQGTNYGPSTRAALISAIAKN